MGKNGSRGFLYSEGQYLSVGMGFFSRMAFWKNNGNDQDRDMNNGRNVSNPEFVNRDSDQDHSVQKNNQPHRETVSHRSTTDNPPSEKEIGQTKQELKELRNFTMDKMDSVADEFEQIRMEVQGVRDQNTKVQGKMFNTVEKAVNRIDKLENKIDSLENKINKTKNREEETKKLEGLEGKIESVEKTLKSEIKRLDKQKVDGQDIVNINMSQDGGNSQKQSKDAKVESKTQKEELRSKRNSSNSDIRSTQDLNLKNLTKKEQAKIRILEMLREGKGKTEIRDSVEGDICSREWFYKAWDELERQEAYITGKGEALIHPEDYKEEIVSRN